MSATASKKPGIVTAPRTSVVVATLLAIIAVEQLRFAFFWAFGTWLPWWMLALFGVLAWFIRIGPALTTEKTERSWLLSIQALAWLIMWLLHFAPSIHWPLIGAPA